MAAIRQHAHGCHALAPKFFPQCLVELPHIPTSKTGKPIRVGLASALGLPPVEKLGGTLWWRVCSKEGTGSLGLAQPVVQDAPKGKDPMATTGEHGDIKAVVQSKCLEVLQLTSIPTSGNLLEYGLDSISVVTLQEELSCVYPQVAMEPVLLMEHTSIEAIAVFVGGQLAQHAAQPGPDAAAAVTKAARRQGWRKAFRKVESSVDPSSGLAMARRGDLEGLRGLVSAGWDAGEMADKHGLTALQWAAGEGHLVVVEYLLNAGVNVNRGSKEGRTPLMWACRNGHLRVAKLLLASGGDVRAVTKKGVSCLHWAVWGGSMQTLRWLVDDVGLDLETVSNAGCNAAIWAASAGRVDVCTWLHGRGANFELVNYWGHGVVSKAAWKGRMELLQWLLVSNKADTEEHPLRASALPGLPSTHPGGCCYRRACSGCTSNSSPSTPQARSRSTWQTKPATRTPSASLGDRWR